MSLALFNPATASSQIAERNFLKSNQVSSNRPISSHSRPSRRFNSRAPLTGAKERSRNKQQQFSRMRRLTFSTRSCSAPTLVQPSRARIVSPFSSMRTSWPIRPRCSRRRTLSRISHALSNHSVVAPPCAPSSSASTSSRRAMRRSGQRQMIALLRCISNQIGTA